MRVQNKLLSLQSHAKINLGLLIKGKRPDGYHLLETLFYPVEIHDTLVISPAEKIRVTMNGMSEKVVKSVSRTNALFCALIGKPKGISVMFPTI